MSRQRPGGGVRVSGGRLRVDAARAIDKLRSYQLADPLAWVLEVVRAGALMPESEAIAVDGSGGDVFVAITCEPPPAETLPQLFDELVDPSTEPRARGLRLLAMGVNSALGRAEGGATTRHVDVYVVGQGGAERVRFTPQLFAVDRETGLARGLRSLVTENAALPQLAPRPRRGVVVHTRAVMSLGLLARWAVGDEPRELALVRDAARELRVPITVQGLPVPADPSIVMREMLPSGGYVALVAPRVGRVGAVLEAAEAGVVLSREPWACGIGDTAAMVPLLLRVDRDRLPTNAARSAVRWDEPAAASALDEAKVALGRLIARLALDVGETRDAARLSWLRAIGIALLAAEVRGVSFRQRLASGVVPDVLAPLLDARLLLDAVGRARTPRELARAPETRVHYESSFAPRDLAPWLGDVIAALPGDPTHALFGDVAPAAAESLVDQATFAKENHAKWLARRIEPARVRDDEGAIVRAPLPEKIAVRGRPPVLVEGEVVLGTAGDERTIDLRVGGRLLETRRARAGVGIAAVAACDALTPTLTYDGAIDDEVCKAVLGAIDDAILESCEALARVILGKDRQPGLRIDAAIAAADPRSAALIRYAILAHVARGDLDAARKDVVKRPLGRAAVWPRLGGGHVSLDELASLDAIGVVPHGRPVPEWLPRTRPVLALGDAERTAIQLLLPRAHFVDYGRVRRPRLRGDELTRIARDRGAFVGLAHDEDTCASVVAWRGDAAGIEAFHMGERMGFHALSTPGTPVFLVVDDERITPDEQWRAGGVDWIALEETHRLRLASGRIARAVIGAWLGAPDPHLFHELPLDAPEIVRAVLERARTPFEEPLRTEERTAIGALPLATSLTGGRTSAAKIREANEGRLAYVPPGAFPPGKLAGLALEVMVAPRDEADGLAALVGVRGATDVTAQVHRDLTAYQREARVRTILARAPETIAIEGALQPTRIVGDGLEGTVGFRSHATTARVNVLVTLRPFAHVEIDELPPHVVATVSIEPRLLDAKGEKPSGAAISRIRGAILAGARAVLVLAVTERPAALFGDAAVRALADALATGRRRGEVGTMLRALTKLPTLASALGTPLSIDDAIVDDELLVLSEPLVPIAPGEDEAPSPFDRPLAVPGWEPDDARAALLQKIAGVTVRDVTREVRALYAKRRARAGLTPRPTLRASHTPALARTLESLVHGTEDEALVTETLGIGAIGLCADTPSRVRFFDLGEVFHEMRVQLVPAFEAAVESPLVPRGRAPNRATVGEIEQALTRALARLLRVLSDENAFDGAPDWALDAQRDAAILGGPMHLERLAHLRLFPTTAGTRVSYDDLRAQHGRSGPIWWTADPHTRLVPLDPDRFALRLAPAHASALKRVLPLLDATKELELDQIARENRARPPLASIAFGPDERGKTIGVDGEEDGTQAELVVAALWPAHASKRELALYVERRALGTVELGGEIPVWARASSSALVPNRTWTGAMRDQTVLAIERRVLELSEQIVLRAITAPPGPFPSLAVDRALMSSIPRPPSRVLRGALTLGRLDLDADDDDGVRVIDRTVRDPDAAPVAPLRATAAKRTPAIVPLVGTLVLWGDTRSGAEATLDALAQHAYERLLAQLAARLERETSPDADLDRAHLVHGAALGLVSTEKGRGKLVMPFGRGALGTLRGVVQLFEATKTVVALTPDEDAGEPVEAIAEHPTFVADGSLAAQRLALALGPRVIRRSDALALALGLRQAAETSAAPAAAPRRPKQSEPPAPTPTPKQTKAKVKNKATTPARSGPVEPLAARTLATLRRVGNATDVVVSASRSTPLVEPHGGSISLAGNSELLTLISGTAVHRERAALVLGAHTISETQTGAQALAALARLLDRSR